MPCRAHQRGLDKLSRAAKVVDQGLFGRSSRRRRRALGGDPLFHVGGGGSHGHDDHSHGPARDVLGLDKAAAAGGVGAGVGLGAGAGAVSLAGASHGGHSHGGGHSHAHFHVDVGSLKTRPTIIRFVFERGGEDGMEWDVGQGWKGGGGGGRGALIFFLI